MVYPVYTIRAVKVIIMSWYVLFILLCHSSSFSSASSSSNLACFSCSGFAWLSDLNPLFMQVMDMLGPSLWDVWNNNSHV